jgi:hypothetical protein
MSSSGRIFEIIGYILYLNSLRVQFAQVDPLPSASASSKSIAA